MRLHGSFKNTADKRDIALKIGPKLRGGLIEIECNGSDTLYYGSILRLSNLFLLF